MTTKNLFIALCLTLLFGTQVNAQKYTTKTGTIRFYSEAPTENIEAFNRQVNSALDLVTGDFVFKVLMQGFQFEKALMQEHFNENYVESAKYPNATFIGKINNIKAFDPKQEGKQEVEVSGNLTIHGVTKNISEKGVFSVKDGIISGQAVFYVKVADYDIKIPGTVVNNIAETIEITVNVLLTELKK